MTKIFRYFKKKEISLTLCSLIFVIAQVWLDLKLPDYMSEITTLVQTPESAMSAIWSAGLKMLLCAFGSLIASVTVGFFAAQIGASLSRRLRAMMFSKVESFSMREINGFSTASLITRSTNDITQVQIFVAMGLQVIIKAPILAAWAITKIAGKSWQWTAATGGAIAVLLIVITIVVVFAMPRFKIIQTLTDNLNRVTRENLIGLRVVRAYNAEAYQEIKFEQANDELTRTHLFTHRTMAVLAPGMSFIMSGLSLAIYWIGAILINNAGMTEKMGLFSDMVVFSSYAMQVVMAFMMLTIIFIMLPRAAVSAKRISEVLDTRSSIEDGTVTETDPEHGGEIEFRNVSFKYHDSQDYVLQDISFTAKKGETVAFIGATGSGKSTLVNLIPRFYDASEGEVLVDGINVREYKLSALYNKLGYVSQRAVLFAGTVTSNVAYGDNGKADPDERDVERAVAIAQGTEFVEKMSGQYDGAISRGGENISGGQKQRVSIARAICREPEIFIFDDSFSALDYKTDHMLRSALKNELKDSTCLIVAQRIGTIKDADRIVVLDEGRAVGIGTHDELMKSCDVYREIAYSQLSREELEDER